MGSIRHVLSGFEKRCRTVHPRTEEHSHLGVIGLADEYWSHRVPEVPNFGRVEEEEQDNSHQRHDDVYGCTTGG
jgi:hypothetical protein